MASLVAALRISRIAPDFGQKRRLAFVKTRHPRALSSANPRWTLLYARNSLVLYIRACVCLGERDLDARGWERDNLLLAISNRRAAPVEGRL